MAISSDRYVNIVTGVMPSFYTAPESTPTPDPTPPDPDPTPIKYDFNFWQTFEAWGL